MFLDILSTHHPIEKWDDDLIADQHPKHEI